MSVFVDDQEKALRFYTDRLGFSVKNDIPLGEYRWLTVVGSDAPDGVELLLEPDENPAAREYTRALAEQGIPAASFAVDDVDAAYGELVSAGVTFVQAPAAGGPVRTAVLDDTCGNLVQLVSPA
ncbi:VOC family protein [Microbacterium invictum]|uniref:VOC family protein n=1 Tax=Microbacterium invictum TaxID=515415 RepID=A0ABZ0V8Q7_9MICO|nr:VOC family protein [Microbacterium invictum]WQB69228.1 VOC family protein [Microbacterium invictum]